MFDSKLIQTLLLFEPKELQQLHFYLESPFFFKGKTAPPKVIELLEYLSTAIKKSDAAKRLNKSLVYQALWGAEDIVKGKLEKIMSNLQRCIEGFIHTQYGKESSLCKEKALIRFYQERKAEKYFLKAIKQFRNHQSKSSTKDKTFFYDQFWVEQAYFEYLALNNRREGDLNIQQTIQQLDVYFLITRLDLLYRLFAQRKYHAKLDLTPVLEGLQNFFPFLEQAHFLSIPQIQISQKMLQFSALDQAKFYAPLKALTDQHYDQIPIEQLKVLAALFRNFCIWRYNLGEVNALQEFFQLYKEHLEKGLLFYDGYLLPSTFKNLVDSGLKCQQATWVFDFLHQYRNKIGGTTNPDEVFNYNLANYYFYQKEFDYALDLLAGQYEDIYYKLDARRLEIKIYFELDSPLLHARMEAFRILILRKSKDLLTKVQSDGNRNFILLLTQILHSKTLHNQERIEKIIQQINDRVVADKAWMHEKLRELQKGKGSLSIFVD